MQNAAWKEESMERSLASGMPGSFTAALAGCSRGGRHRARHGGAAGGRSPGSGDAAGAYGVCAILGYGAAGAAGKLVLVPGLEGTCSVRERPPRHPRLAASSGHSAAAAGGAGGVDII